MKQCDHVDSGLCGLSISKQPCFFVIFFLKFLAKHTSVVTPVRSLRATFSRLLV